MKHQMSVFREKRKKENIFYNEAEDTLSYTQPVEFHFRQDLSSGTESDLLTMINVPLVVSYIKIILTHFLNVVSVWCV